MVRLRQGVHYRAVQHHTKTFMNQHRRLVSYTLLVVMVVSFYLLVSPYIPRLYYWLFRPKINASSYEQAAASGKKTNDNAKPGNRLVLPDIGVDGEIKDGKNLNVISKGRAVWRETPKVDPSVPGNMVMAGHRILGYGNYKGDIFYNLTELKSSQIIYVKWNEKVYKYEIIGTKTVDPTQVDIRNADPEVEYKLTIYTCTPLGSTAKRFVVFAKQVTP